MLFKYAMLIDISALNASGGNHRELNPPVYTLSFIMEGLICGI